MVNLDRDASLLQKFVSQPRPAAVTFGVGVVLLMLPFLAAFLDGQLANILEMGYWRPLLIGPVIIIYILIISPILAQNDNEVLRAFRPIVLLDDQQFSSIVVRAGRINRLYETLIFLLGALFGAWLGSEWLRGEAVVWLFICTTALVAMMFGLLAVVVYWSILGTRLTAALHHQPLKFDLFDLKPFEPIGRQSLVIALAFVGGITLSILFSFDPQNFFAWQNFIVYIPLALVPLLVFFLNMRDTHRVLAQAKKGEMENVERTLVRAARELTAQLDARNSTDRLAAEINALAVYQNLLRGARTWPYNTTMLRTLFVSIFIPASIALASKLLEGYLKR